MPSRDSKLANQAAPDTRWYPSWQAAGLHGPEIDKAGHYWLTLAGSLTRELQLRCREHFHVEILNEGFLRPSREESLSLGLPQRQAAWIREVRLCGDGQPWVMARTVIPLTTLKGRGRRLRHLGRKPLGAYLFSHPEWQRGRFQTGLCECGDNAAMPLVARRSRFFSSAGKLLVGEYFLPALLKNSGNPY